MELPKNIVQIGRPDKVHKIFVEDYVVSYIKQLNKACDGKAAGIALYGKHCEEEGCHYYFLYGASKIQGLEQRGPYLSQADRDEIDETGKKYFDEYEFLAWCSIKGEPLESFYVLVQGKGIEISGYAYFYEKNESMLNYMLLSGESGNKNNTSERRTQTTEFQGVGQKNTAKPGRGEWRAADYMRIPETPEEKKSRVEKKNEASRKSEHMKIAVAAAFLVLCVIGITTLNDYGKLEDLQVAARNVIASMTEQKIPDAQPEGSPAPEGTTGTDGNTGILNGEGTLPAETDVPNTPPPFWPPVQSPSVSDGQGTSGMPQPSGEDNAGAGTQQGQDNGGQGAPAGQEGTDSAQGNMGTGTPQESQGTQGQDNIGGETQQGQDGNAVQSGQGEAVSDAQSNAVQPQQPEPVAYTVVKGDTLIDICMKRYGTLEKIDEICHLNGISNADNIQVGQTILLP